MLVLQGYKQAPGVLLLAQRHGEVLMLRLQKIVA